MSTSAASSVPTRTLHSLPRPARVWRRQFLLPLESGRVWVLLAAVACIGLFYHIEGNAVQPPVLRAYELLLLAGPAWALLLWNDERRLARRYHWSMPVEAAAHDLARVFTGGVWLVSASVIYCMMGLLPDNMTTNASAAPTLFWLQCFTTPLLLYVFASVITVRTDRGAEWVLGIGALVGSIAFLLESALRGYVAFVAPIFERGLGLQTALFAGHDVFLDAIHYQRWIAEAHRPVAYHLQDVASTGQTIVSISLFTGIAVLLLVMSAYRYRRRV